jgi:hypothetical protein
MRQTEQFYIADKSTENRIINFLQTIWKIYLTFS